MEQLFSSLNSDEIRQFYGLFKDWQSGDRALNEVAQKMIELFGPSRKHLLARMRPFVKMDEMEQFEQMIEQCVDGEWSSDGGDAMNM